MPFSALMSDHPLLFGRAQQTTQHHMKPCISIDINGYAWIFMDIHGYQLIYGNFYLIPVANEIGTSQHFGLPCKPGGGSQPANTQQKTIPALAKTKSTDDAIQNKSFRVEVNNGRGHPCDSMKSDSNSGKQLNSKSESMPINISPTNELHSDCPGSRAPPQIGQKTELTYERATKMSRTWPAKHRLPENVRAERHVGFQ